MRRIALILPALLMVPAALAQAPPTVYEEPDIPPQAMDFDADNNRFVAHPGWLNDKLVHYYKFRMYVPPNYGTNDGGLGKVPVAPVYLPTTTGALDGVPEGQGPVFAEFPSAGNTDYSDFMRIHFVTVLPGYEANSHTSVAQLVSAGITQQASNIIVNMPIVPMDSTLEDPAAPGTDAPISPWMGWYEGDAVQSFVFESTSQAFADHINPLTRQGAATGSGYESTVSADMVTQSGGMNAIPIWHVNQYFTGVTAGVNNGGPAQVGQRNVIDKDRLDAGYSPLWQVFWITKLPHGYQADQASHATQFSEDNGFATVQTPMYVNCPNIGPHGGGAVNPDKATSFDAVAKADGDTLSLEGSLIMQGGAPVKAFVNGEEVASATTNMMGGYQFDIAASALPSGDGEVEIRDGDGNVVQTFSVAGSAGVPGPGFALIALALLGAVAAVRRR